MEQKWKRRTNTYTGHNTHWARVCFVLSFIVCLSFFFPPERDWEARLIPTLRRSSGRDRCFSGSWINLCVWLGPWGKVRLVAAVNTLQEWPDVVQPQETMRDAKSDGSRYSWETFSEWEKIRRLMKCEKHFKDCLLCHRFQWPFLCFLYSSSLYQSLIFC